MPRGFTLLELTITIALVALAAALVIPRLAARDDVVLRLAAEDVARRLAAARWQAVVEGRTVVVPLDALAPDLRVVHADGDPIAGARPIVFPPVPPALPRTVVLADAAGTTARITIPGGLAAMVVTLGEAS